MSHFDWDDRAINFTLAAHNVGRSPIEIHTQLIALGYLRLRLVTVEQCLRMNGHNIPLSDPIYYPEMNHGILWNDFVHAYTLSAYLLDESADEILQELLQAGYNVRIEQVVASLQLHGFENVRIFSERKMV